MDERPPQPPEGKLIADAIAASGLSIREASRRAGISYGRWRQITSGYQNVSPGSYAAVRAPDRTLARMALVAGIAPEQLEQDGQRAGAAQVLRELLQGKSPEPERPRLEAVPGPLSAAQLPETEPDAELLAAWGRSDETVGRLLALRNDAGTGPLPWKEKREFLLLLLRLRATGGSEEERERRQS